MILVHILSKRKEQLLQIAKDLFQSKLIIDAVISKSENVEFDTNKESLISTHCYLLQSKTKALLITTIEQILRERYTDQMPVFYSLPIVHMDWEQAENLIKRISPMKCVTG